VSYQFAAMYMGFVFWTNPALIQLFATPFLAKHGIPSIYVTYTLLFSNIIIFFTTILGGFLSDLVGRRTTIVLSALLVAIFVYPYTILIQSGNLLYILIAQILINAFAFICEGAFTAYFPEIYRAQFTVFCLNHFFKLFITWLTIFSKKDFNTCDPKEAAFPDISAMNFQLTSALVEFISFNSKFNSKFIALFNPFPMPIILHKREDSFPQTLT